MGLEDSKGDASFTNGVHGESWELWTINSYVCSYPIGKKSVRKGRISG